MPRIPPRLVVVAAPDDIAPVEREALLAIGQERGWDARDAASIDELRAGGPAIVVVALMTLGVPPRQSIARARRIVAAPVVVVIAHDATAGPGWLDGLGADETLLLPASRVEMEARLRTAARLLEARWRSEEEIPIVRPVASDIVASAHFGVLGTDLDHRINAWNAALEEMTGVRAEHAIGRRREAILSEGSLPVPAEEAVTVKDVPLQVLPTGRRIWVDATTRRGDAGAVTILHDVTERRATEEAARAFDEKFRTLCEALPDGILVHDGTAISYVNQRLVELLGHPDAESLLRCRPYDLVHRADRRRVRDRVRATLAGRLSRPVDVLFLRHDHTPLRVEVDARRVMAHGRPSTLVVVRDLAARLQVEEERERLLAVAEAARTEATKMLAHVRRLSTLLVQAQESERRAIARELHDEIGQCVTGLSFTLEAAARGPPEPFLASARIQTRELIQRVRSLSLELRPGMLDDLGLLAALTWHIARFGEQTSIQVGFAHAGLDRRFSSEVETAAYRIVQAALTNVARHAACATASVRAWATSGLVGVQIEDSGAGFAVEPVLARGETTGISGMRERARLLGGDLAIESTIGYGTRVTATLPLRSP